MPAYKAPLREIKFVLYELLKADSLSNTVPAYADATPDVIDAILEEAGKFCENELQPLNHPGDEEGCHFENGVVTTPKGFKEAYAKFVEGGWPGLPCDPDYGGQGLPKLINFAVEEMICSANLSFGMYPGLSNGNYNAIHAHGSEEQKKLYLPKLVSGEWSGTMCLTEPQCGTDLGLCKTRAEANADGSYNLFGTKIFISAGEHDLTANIIHLVLARLPDAPAGIRGISLFVCPKFLPTRKAIRARATRSPAARSRRRWGSRPHRPVSSISTRPGLAGRQTEQGHVGHVHHDEHRAAGRRHAGPRHRRGSLSRRRHLRQGPAADALGCRREVPGEAGRSDHRASRRPPHAAEDAIAHRSFRALSYWMGMELDIAAHHPDPERRQSADDLVALLTPVVKAFLTDHGFDAANLGVQVFGGHGYIREWGMEQLVRDARITQIYEGTNGIQALDLVGRKLGTGVGRLARRFFHPVSEYIETASEKPELQEFALPTAKAFAKLQQATAWLAQAGLADPEEAGAAATDFLRLFALTALAYMWCRMAEIALEKKTGHEAAFYEAKLAAARFFMARLLPETNSLFTMLTAGKSTLMALPAEAF